MARPENVANDLPSRVKRFEQGMRDRPPQPFVMGGLAVQAKALRGNLWQQVDGRAASGGWK